jgi:hypothetical protein
MRECSDILKVMTMRLEAFGGSPGVLERLIAERTSAVKRRPRRCCARSGSGR